MSGLNPMKCHLALTKMLYCIVEPKTLCVNNYKLGSIIIPTVLQFKDLGVLRFERRTLGEHVKTLSASCHRLAGMIKRVFKSHDDDLLWTTFKTYVIPKIMYASSVWNPLAKQDNVSLERVQRRFTKSIHNFAYENKRLLILFFYIS